MTPAAPMSDVDGQDQARAWFEAAKRGDIAAMAAILALQPALINASDHSQGMEPAMTALQLCVWHNHTVAVAWLVDVGGADLEVANERGVTPLLLDIMRIGIQKMRLMPLLRLCHVDMSSRVEVARLQRSFAKDRSSYGDIDTSTLNVLLARGANVNHCSNDGDTALLLAVDEGLIMHTQILLESGADAHFRDARGRTVLEIACEHGYMDIAQLLLNTAPTLFHVAGKPIAFRCALCTDDLVLATKSLALGLTHSVICGNATVQLSDRLLHVAVEYDARECVRFLLSSGVDVDWHDGEDGARAIHLACRLQNTELLRVLLGHKADPNVFCKVEAEKRESNDDDENRWVSPYHIVTLRYGYEQIDLLAEHGADINLCHPNQDSPLVLAAKENVSFELMERLIRCGARFRFPTSASRDAIAPILTKWLHSIAPAEVPVLVETILNVPGVITDNALRIVSAWIAQFQAHAVVLKLLNDALDWKPASYLH